MPDQSESTPNVAPEPMIVADPDLLMPADRRFWTSDEMFPVDKEDLPVPHFSVQEVSKVFFGKGADWLRWRMRPETERKNKKTGEVAPGRYPEGYFLLDGKPLEFKRTPAGARYFTLADIEKMAHALAQGGHIDGAQLANIVVLVKVCSKIHGVNP